jgi:anti-sigma-K factor RskA
MTSSDQNQGGRAHDEIVAGEYVLGVLSIEARRRVEQRMTTDRAFAEIVARWQTDLASFNDEYEDVIPPAYVLGQIERRLFGARESTFPARRGLWHSVVFWRSLSFGASAIALVAIVSAGGLIPATTTMTKSPLVAELSAPGSNVSLLASFDAASGHMRIVPVAAGRPRQNSLELWLVPGSGNPLSLGVFQPEADGEIVIPADLRGNIGEGATLAVTLEPFGGSPTGLPTGPVVASGAARRL